MQWKIVGASAITGYAADEINQAENIINEEIIGDELNNSYAWYTKKEHLQVLQVTCMEYMIWLEEQ